jgi:predicted enzyme related to lactoylglutathione lyase
MTGRFIWYELLTRDADAAEAFYGAVVGWKALKGPPGGMDYRQWQNGDSAVGGLMALPDGAEAMGMKPAWLPYIHVPDVNDAIARAVAAGARLDMPRTDIPGVGAFAMLADPQGASFYVMTPTGEGESTVFSPGVRGQVGWNELHAKDGEAALAFYAGLFGWRMSSSVDMGEMGLYRVFTAGQGDLGGMMTSPGFPRPLWMHYFNVEDIDAGKARVEAAGGSVRAGPHPVPTGEWMIHAIDPQGAFFGLLGPKKG